MMYRGRRASSPIVKMPLRRNDDADVREWFPCMRDLIDAPDGAILCWEPVTDIYCWRCVLLMGRD